MPTTTERPTGRRLALVIATGTYADPALAGLRAPGQDASDLADVLENAAIGGFEVEAVLDAPAESLRRRIAQFCAQVAPGDLALVYLSCHGVLDDRGRLYYATADTDRALLSATAVPSAWLNEQLEDCRGRRQILVLDCCHSGAFAKGAKGESELALGQRFEGRGRVVLTGSRGTEYSFEHDQVVGESTSSVFTGALVAGLRSGDADRDGDGVVSVSELYDYAYDAVREQEARQTPTLWTYGAEGDLAVAQSPRGAIVKPVPLPEDLVMLLESARPRVRESGVRELAELLTGSDPGRALTARAMLERIAAEDVAAVAAAARAALEADPAAAETPASEGPAEKGPAKPPSPPQPPVPAESRPGDGPPPRPRRRLTIAALAALLVALAAAAAAVLAGSDGDGDEPDAVGVIPAASQQGTIAVPGSPRGVAVDGDFTWVSRYDEGDVVKIDSSSQTAQVVDVSDHPGKLAVGEGTAWVSVEDGKRLERIEPEALSVDASATIDLTTDGCADCAPSELLIASGRLWVGEPGALRSFDVNTGKPVGKDPYRPGSGFEGVFAIEEKGKGIIWALGNENGEGGSSFVISVDPVSGEADPTPAGTGVFLNAITTDGSTLWVADSEDGHNTVSNFFAENGKFVKVAKVRSGISTADLVYADEQVLVWDPSGGFLTPIPAWGKNQEPKPQRIKGFEPGKVNEEGSDFAVAGGFAWITEPAGDKLYKEPY
ncbi:MAG TPA: caspase family protein [Solirubrobacterales bacterium]|nr:caspase family protein [Solirubrobacterales bacterium]